MNNAQKIIYARTLLAETINDKLPPRIMQFCRNHYQEIGFENSHSLRTILYAWRTGIKPGSKINADIKPMDAAERDRLPRLLRLIGVKKDSELVVAIKDICPGFSYNG